MCLMCEYYLESCRHEECYNAADPDDQYESRSGQKWYLWRGWGKPICPEMVLQHDNDCACLTGSNECNCGYDE